MPFGHTSPVTIKFIFCGLSFSDALDVASPLSCFYDFEAAAKVERARALLCNGIGTHFAH